MEGEEEEGGDDCWIEGAWLGIGVGLDGERVVDQRVGREEEVDRTHYYLLQRKREKKSIEKDR